MTNMHGDNESDSGDDKSHHPHKKPNLYVGIIIASILIASPFILYNYFSSPTVESQSQQLTPIEGEEPIAPLPPASEINPESINMIQSSIDNLQQSIVNLDSKLNQQTNQLFQLSQSEKKEDKSMFNFSDLNPFAEKKEETPAPIPSPPLNPIDPSPPVNPNPNPSFNFNPSPKPLEQTPFPAPTAQSEEPSVNFNDSEPNPPPQTANTEFKTGGQKRTYRKKHGKKQNYSKKLLNKFLKKLSTL